MPVTASTMREALIVGPTSFDVVERPIPDLQSDDELLLQTAACGICSGDLMPWYLEKKIGSVLGHEAVGFARKIGHGVDHIQKDDLVFVHHHAPCLDCEHCARKAYVHCPTWRKSCIDPGGMAEWIRVPAAVARNDCFAVNDLDVEQAFFIEPLGCSVKALRRLANLVDLTAEHTFGVVVGCGVMGLLNLAAARAVGVRRLVAVEPDASRRVAATQFGADLALTPDEAAQQVHRQADFVIVGPGFPDVIRQSLDYLRPGGTALLFTPTPHGVLTSLDLGDLYFRDINLVPSYSCGPDDTQDAYAMLRHGRVDPRPMITHRFPLAEVQKAYDTAKQGGPVLKVIVKL